MMAPSSTVLVPLQANAFLLNPSPQICDVGAAKIAPITQPNYTFLRLTDNLLEADVLDHVDLHCASPANRNSRLTDLGTGNLRQNRVGVYLHWTLPQVYRSGSAAVKGSPNAATARKQTNGTTIIDPSSGNPTVDHAQRKLQQGYPPAPKPVQPDYSAPEFRPAPNRWIVVRRIDPSSVPSNVGIPLLQAFVVESDRLSYIDDIGPDEDLETDYSPFINALDLQPDGGRIIDGQAECFIGLKKSLADWTTWRNSKSYKSSYLPQFTVLTSSNPLFADYVPQNMNVFSIVDNFAYQSGGKTVYLDSATADYHVIGWHSNAANDPFTTDSSISPDKVPIHSDRMSDCNMTLKDPNSGSAAQWIGSSAPTRTLCHASLYGVKYSKTTLPNGVTSLATQAGTRLNNEHPIAIGVTPLDALLAYSRVHATPAPQTVVQDKTQIDPSPMGDIESDLLKIQALLLASESDDVDGLQAAADESFEEAFTKFDGGTFWHYQLSTAGAKPAPPPDTNTFIQYNNDQAAYDNCYREGQQLRWNIFAEWWNYISGLGENTDKLDYQNKLKLWYSQLTAIGNKMAVLKKALPDAATNPIANVQKGTNDRFYQRNDPTILFGGIKSGFEPDFSSALPIRLQDQICTPSTSISSQSWNSFVTFASSVTSTPNLIPSELQQTALACLKEFYILSPSNPGTVTTQAPQTIPWFHNEPTRNPPENRGRDLYNNTQPWLPLFIEWEAYYYHIPITSWRLQESGRRSNWDQKVLHYGFDHDISADKINNKVKVAGRVVLQPQASSLLKVALDQIFRTTNPQDLNDIYSLSNTQQQALLASVSSLDFVSSTLTGLTSGLLTMHEGSHMKPMVRLPNEAPVPIQVALDAAAGIKFTKEMMQAMDIETKQTPYGDSVSFETADPPVKLATHGQLMFTKLNIIDKFGQAICAIDPTPHHTIPAGIPLPTISPCLGDTYYPGTIGDTKPDTAAARANTVLAQSDHQACPFVQLTPSINQPARLNAHFVIRDATTNLWRPCSEWEPCIWGWLVVNYADYGLQFFLADGTFYREIRVGGPTGATAQPKWVPFDRPTKLGPDVRGRDIGQLDYLIAKCAGDDNYMQAFFDMINQSVEENQSYPPNAYSAFPSAMVGKPLALVNTGWSLELAGPENLNWSTVNEKDPYPKLIGRPPGNTSNDWYQFPVKLGDRERTYDGLVGYFKTPDKPPVPTTSPGATGLLASDFDLGSVYTYFVEETMPDGTVSTKSDGVRIPISPQNFPVMDPYYISSGSSTATSSAQTLMHNAKLQVFGMIIDPYLPVHGYSAILPNQPLKLPNWQVEEGLKNISAFFHFGPLLVPNDVPPAPNAAYLVTEEYSTQLSTQKQGPTPSTQIPQVAIPVQSHQDWKWLQPYVVEGDNVDPITGEKSTFQTKFAAYDLSPDAAVGQDAQEIRLANGPYTAVEGYLQLVATPST